MFEDWLIHASEGQLFAVTMVACFAALGLACWVSRG